jgi:predicted ATPase/class 3 adenylate cyclase
MRTCPFCDSELVAEDAAFCSRCGVSLQREGAVTGVTDRLRELGGEIRMLSVFFVHFSGFEALVDQQIDKDVMINLRECLAEVETFIQSFKGTANQIIADTRVLAVFGAPRAHKDDPLRALNCALEIKNWWKRKKEDRVLLRDIDMTIGIHTGRAFFGYIIEQYSFLTVIGDTINIAARLTGICPADEILMSESTYNRLVDYVDAEHIGERSVKGRTTKVDTYVVKGIKKEPQTTPVQKLPFCGRATELEKLKDIATRIQKKGMQFCTISGQMGIGKTRLKEEFEKYVTESDACDYMETHCSVEIESPYFPFKLLLKQYFKINEFDTKDVVTNKIHSTIAQKRFALRYIQGLKHLFETDVTRLSHEELLRINEEIYVSIKHLIKHECRDKALVLIFEEFHKADEMSKHIISYLASELKNEPVMFLMVNVSKDFVANINVPVHEINLSPLSVHEIKELVTSILGDVDERIVDFFFHSAGGNPLFTIEAIRNTRRTKIIKNVSGRWLLDKDQRLSFLDDLYGVVMSTIDSLASNYRLIIDYASVIGYSFSLRVLDRLLMRAHLHEQLDYLVTEGYIMLSKNGDDPVYVFRHNLLKDAAYTVLPLRKRKEIHQHVAALLEEIYVHQIDDFYESIGHHSLSCEDFKKAAHYFKLAGDKAKNLYAFNQAISLYNTVLKINREREGKVSADTVRDVYLHFSDIYEISGDIQKMMKIAQQGLESARADKQRADEMNFIERYAYGLFLNHRLDEAAELLLTSIEQCDEDMPEILSIMHSDLGLLYQTKFEYEKSILEYNISWRIARDNAMKKAERVCLLNLARIHTNLGNYEQALEYLDYGIEELVSDDVRWQVHFKAVIGAIYYRMWDLEKADAVLTECLRLADEIGYTEASIKAALQLAIISITYKKAKAAQDYIERADSKITFMVREHLMAEINFMKASVYHQLGEHTRAHNLLTSALSIAEKLEDREIICQCYTLLALTDPENGMKHAMTALDAAEQIKLPPLIALALYRVTQGYVNENNREKSRYYGRKALLMYDDVKMRLTDGHRKTYVQRPEYVQLLEI